MTILESFGRLQIGDRSLPANLPCDIWPRSPKLFIIEDNSEPHDTHEHE
jgi:hypothetical protein